MKNLQKGSLYLGKYWDIKVFIHWTFLILPIWIALVSLNAGYDIITIIWNILLILAVFVCVTLHEFGHALTARKYNFKTRHITLLPIGGVATFESLPEKPRQEFEVAIAGPLVNFVIAGCLFIIFYLSGSLRRPMDDLAPGPDNFFYLLMLINFFIGLFNLIPAFPMDGGRILRALLSFRMSTTDATRVASALGQFIAVIFIFLGFFYNFFLIFIGIFVYLGARAELNMVVSKSILTGYTVNDVLMHKYHILSPGDTLGKAVMEMLDSEAHNFLIMDSENVMGTLNRQQILDAMNFKSEESTPVHEIMNRNVEVLSPSMPLEDLYNKLRTQPEKKDLMAVIDRNTVVGVLDMENIM